jgi:hypothetical protein
LAAGPGARKARRAWLVLFVLLCLVGRLVGWLAMHVRINAVGRLA